MIEKDILIIGAGFGGLGAAIKLIEAGFQNFEILERSDRLGGTWRDNIYPGCACDIKSHLYSFSFFQNYDWSHAYGSQYEILNYMNAMSESYKLENKIRFNCNVQSMEYDKTTSHWQVKNKQGKTFGCRMLILATGPLNVPKIPEIKGFGNFGGTHFHSSLWPKEIELKGKSVSIIGTGASAVQIIPQIADQVEKLYVFQRTAPWILPKAQMRYNPILRLIFKFFPLLKSLNRQKIYWFNEMEGTSLFRKNKLRRLITKMAENHIKKQIKDEVLRKKVRPNYEMGCKRRLPSNDYYPALCKSNVELIDQPILAFDEKSILVPDKRYPTDLVIFATGFHVTDFLRRSAVIKGKDGTSLFEHWDKNDAEAYMGSCIAGFPNLFFILGPNTGLGHNSQLHIMESQYQFLIRYANQLFETNNRSIDVKQSIQDDFNKKLQKQLLKTVWNSGGCASWYLNKNGKNVTLWPSSTFDFRKKIQKISWRNFDIHDQK